MNNIKLEMNNLTEEERKQLMALVEKANKPKRWKPEKGEMCWYITGANYVFKDRWDDNGTDISYYSLHNCFKTEAEAEFEAKKHRVYNELLTYAEEHNGYEIDWEDDGQPKWNMYYSHHENKICYAEVYGMHNSFVVYFTSEKIVQDAVKSVGEDRIKKYLFGVE